MSLSLYFHTIRHLRPVQLFGRARFRLSRRKPKLFEAPVVRSPATHAWLRPAGRRQTQFGPARFRFLNIEREVRAASDWNNPAWEKLWLYNLHYFDDLNAHGAAARLAWHRSLMQRWMEENPPGLGNGWEPYTLSLRVTNWVKWALAGNVLAPEALQSLATQARYLASRLEYHLMGNHLLANAKALVFAGLFFEGPEAKTWLVKGLQILVPELKEQILPDGGHFERSPMYHNIVLEDVIDLLNVMNSYANATEHRRLAVQWQRCAAAMLSCARALVHPDGEIALVNDAALGIAAPLCELEDYAKRLHIDTSRTRENVTHMEDLGYLRAEIGDAWALLDVGRIGPDYLPGHAHADTLSFELSIGAIRVIVDSGTSTYASTAERLRQRSTSAHNTVEIDATSSSEVWGSFRVARRAYPFGLEMVRRNDMIRVRCAHDGYARLKGRPVHWREWIMREGGMVVDDTVNGAFKSAIARFHFHPECTLIRCDERTGAVAFGTNRTLSWFIEKGRGRVRDSTYHPEFGMSVPGKCLEIELEGSGARTHFDWAGSR